MPIAEKETENKVYRLILGNKGFNRLTFKLSSKVHISVDKARSILLDFTFDKVTSYKRSFQVDDLQIIDLFQFPSKASKYFFNYTIYNAYKDAVRQTLDLKDHIRISHNGKSYSIHTCQFNEFNLRQAINNASLHNELNIEQIIDIIYQVLPSSAAKFASYVLLYGEQETKAVYCYDSNRFYQRIRYIEKIMRKKRVKYRHLLLSPLERHQQKDLKRLNLLINCLESPDYNDVKFSNLLSKMQNVTIITNLLADNVSNIRLFIQSFGQDKQEAYRFINALYRQYNYLKKKLRDA